jgi:predicted metal-dependent RNase
MNFTARIKPKKVLVNHGEKSKSENVASNIFSRFKIGSIVPDNREIIKLK